jgi:hypothetical protein
MPMTEVRNRDARVAHRVRRRREDGDEQEGRSHRLGRSLVQAMHRHTAAVVALLALLLLPGAAAHPDGAVVEGSLSLAPGEAVAFPMSVHFHRLVATYRVEGAQPVVLEVVTGADASAGRVAYQAPLVDRGRLHHLLACCLDAAFSDYSLVVRNEGAERARLHLRAWLVHDEFAVVAWAAEPGAVEVPGVLFLGLGVGSVLAAVGVRRRRGGAAADPGRREAAGGRAYRWSLRFFAPALLLAVTAGIAGALRYGTGVVSGMVAIMADIPVPGGPFGSRASVLMGLLLLAWVVSIVLWIVAVRRGRVPTASRVMLLGGALAAVSLGGAAAMALDYGLWLVPVGLGLALAAPLAASVFALASGSRSARRLEHDRAAHLDGTPT